MKRFTIILISSIYLVATTGCSSLTGVDPSMLNKTSKQNHVEIKVPFKWEEQFSVAPVTHHLTLKSGKYKAYLDDRNGTYYEGIGECLEWKHVYDDKEKAPDVYNYRCGVYIPDNKEGRAKVYFYSNPEAEQSVLKSTNSGVLVRALSEAELDNLKHLMYQPDEELIRKAIEIIK